MELENIMQCMLIKGKKMYMCLKENGTLYKRGFNVKKDSPLFLRQCFDDVIMGIMKNHSLDCILDKMVQFLMKKRDEFCVENCEDYCFSQTLNETKDGSEGSAVTVAYMLFVQLKNDSNTKYVPSSGDRIPYLLIDKPNASTVRDRAKPTQLFNDQDIVNWSKHLNIICTFLNDIMSMLGNDDLFVLALKNIAEYFQKDQRYDILYPVIKVMTKSRVKDIVCKELNIKEKKDLTEEKFMEILVNREFKFIHQYEFGMLKRPVKYNIVEDFDVECPVCNNRGESAVTKKMSFTCV